MIRPIAFGSSSTGPLGGFTNNLADQKETSSITIDDGFNLSDTSFFKVLHQIEPEAVLDCVDNIIKYHEFYDLILCWNKRILESCPNAKLFPQGTCTWMDWGCEKGDYNVLTCDPSKKKFKASFLTSVKSFTPGQALRQQIYQALPPVVGTLPIEKYMTGAGVTGVEPWRNPQWLPSKRMILDEYQFHITPQNASQDNWFDDKLQDALIAKTIPLYWGCPNVSDFFNMDGIIHFKTMDELMQRLSELTPDYYEKHRDAVEDNFIRATKYVHVYRRLDEELAAGIERKLREDVRPDISFFTPERAPYTYGFRPLRKP